MTKEATGDRLTWTISETARNVHVSVPTVYSLIAKGKIKSPKVGSRRLVLIKSVHEYLERAAEAAQPRDPRVEKMVAARQAKRTAKRSIRPRLNPK